MKRIAILLIGLVVVACGGGQAGPATPTGDPDIGGQAMTSAPPPNAKDVVPESQQQAQDTIFGYLKRTLDALPPGTVLDATRYGTAGHNNFCDDNDTRPSAPMHFQTIGQLNLPQGSDVNATVITVGGIWRSWGWQVMERDGFRKPNQFGYGPDGYRLQIVTAARDGFPPTVQAVSPCFPGTLARDDIEFPLTMQSGG